MSPNKSKCVSSANQNWMSKNSTVNGNDEKHFHSLRTKANFPWAFFLGIWPDLIFSFYSWLLLLAFALPFPSPEYIKRIYANNKIRRIIFRHNIYTSCIGNIAVKSLDMYILRWNTKIRWTDSFETLFGYPTLVPYANNFKPNLVRA